MSADIEEQYDKIYRYCYLKPKTSLWLKTLTQECFLEIYLSEYLCGTWKRTAYLYTIARNLCMDTFRHESLCPSG